ncbi:MAG TPA: histidinol-phosphatase [Candidatus Hydrogenedentes bacterium]|nr:histidinol-phosphatase [Candidatus Hydrogenedentota bacterium]HNT86881.1 histidinol-phosphatase [Candidatus Hydrogenedentota bacterium]
MSSDCLSPWRVSLHGGHSGEFCDHGDGTLEDVVRAAVAVGCPVYGLTEHAPRVESRFLFAEEREMGWDVPYLEDLFARYARRMDALAAEYADRIVLLKGFEVEVVPKSRYVEIMTGLRREHNFEYIVGSVHYVDEVIIDYTQAEFDRAVARCGGLEALAVRYYETVAEMVVALRPEIVGHFDLVRKQAPDEASVSTPRVRVAACAALDTVRDCGGILDVNTSGYRRGLGRPYPAPWIVEAARARGIPFAFGDDSHRPSEVGAGINDVREYLLSLGVTEIAVLARGRAGLEHRAVSLLDD